MILFGYMLGRNDIYPQWYELYTSAENFLYDTFTQRILTLLSFLIIFFVFFLLATLSGVRGCSVLLSIMQFQLNLAFNVSLRLFSLWVDKRSLYMYPIDSFEESEPRLRHTGTVFAANVLLFLSPSFSWQPIKIVIPKRSFCSDVPTSSSALSVLRSATSSSDAVNKIRGHVA